MPKHPSPSFTDYLANLRNADGPLNAMRGLISNTWAKVRRLEGCCGNYGAPGC